MARATHDTRCLRVPSRRTCASSRTRAPRAHRREALVALSGGTWGTAWPGPPESRCDGGRPPTPTCGGSVRLAATWVDTSRLRPLASTACAPMGSAGGWPRVGRWVTNPGLPVQPTGRGPSRTWIGIPPRRIQHKTRVVPLDSCCATLRRRQTCAFICGLPYDRSFAREAQCVMGRKSPAWFPRRSGSAPPVRGVVA